MSSGRFLSLFMKSNVNLDIPPAAVLIGSGLFCLHAEGRDCMSVGPDEVNEDVGATLSLNGFNPVCQPEY